MWLPEKLLSHLDQGVARSQLAGYATLVARRTKPGLDAEFYWDDTWIWRVGRHCFPFGDRLPLAEPDWNSLIALPDKRARESADYWFHSYRPTAGDVIIDVGAGIGQDILAFSAAVGAGGRIWAVEAHPYTFKTLRKFCALNSLANVTCLNYACVDRPGEYQIETGSRHIANHVWQGPASVTSVSTMGVPLDDLCADLQVDQVAFLEMNIEGAEKIALPGAIGVLRKTRHVCVAAHDFRADRGDGEHFRTADFVKEFLSTIGFKVSFRTDDKRAWVPHHIHGVRS